MLMWAAGSDGCKSLSMRGMRSYLLPWSCLLQITHTALAADCFPDPCLENHLFFTGAAQPDSPCWSYWS